MFLPLKDFNPTTCTPYVTLGIMGICILVFLWEAASGNMGMNRIIYEYGLIPAHFFGTAQPLAGANTASPSVTLITSMFLHGGWMHLIGNMLFLWVFGNNIEDELGPIRFVIFYLLSGLAAGFLQMGISPDSAIPMVGASGAVSGVLGAYLLLHPRVKILTLIFLGFFIMMRKITAAWFLGIWIAYQGLFAILDQGGVGGGTAWWAHIGGFVAGVALLFVLRPRRTAALSRKMWKQSYYTKKLPKKPAPKRQQRDNVKRGPWG